MTKLIDWYQGLPDGWFIQKLFYCSALLAVGTISMDALGYLDRADSALRTKIEVPERVEFIRPKPGDNLRPYQPAMIPKSNPERIRLPDGSELDGDPLKRMKARFVMTESGVPVIVAVGDIETGIAEEFKRLHEQNDKKARYLILVSRGGLVQEAMQLGHYVRDQKIKTIIPKEGICFSSCPLVLAGGIERVVYPDAWVGLHRARLVKKTPSAALAEFESGQAAAADVMDYLIEMDVDPLLWHTAIKTPFESIHLLAARGNETNQARHRGQQQYQTAIEHYQKRSP